MAFEPVVGDKYLITWADMGKPTVQGDVKVPGLGVVYLDDADIHYALTNASTAAFYVRASRALGDGFFVTVARVQSA